MLINLLLLICIGFLATITYKLSILESLLVDNYTYIDETVGEDDSDEMPDQTPDQVSNPMTDQDLAELLGSEALHIKNLSHDEKIQALMAELKGETVRPPVQPGIVQDLPHDEVDKMYIKLPKVEYAE